MKFSDTLERINTELDKFENEEVKEEKKQPKSVNYKDLAEKAIVVKHLKEKKELSVKEKNFIAQVETIELSDEDRVKVKEQVDALLKESYSKKKKKMKKDKDDEEAA